MSFAMSAEADEVGDCHVKSKINASERSDEGRGGISLYQISLLGI
jgi:hypothetical protein